MTRYVYLVFAYVFLVCAVIGVIVPGIPTVPFLLLTAWCSARGSERLHRWLYEHPYFGGLLADWETQGAISRRTKVVTVVMLLASWVVMYLRIDSTWLLAVIAVLLIGVMLFVVSRPEPRKPSLREPHTGPAQK